MLRIHGRADGERGIALVMALLVILVVTLLSVVLMMNINTESKITGHSLRETEALNTADAGIGEAQGRIRNQEGPNDPTNPRLVTQIFNCLPGSVPVLGADSTALPTGQPAGQWLNYSTATKGPDVLTITYKTDAARTVVYRYDQNLSPPAGPVNTATGMPIYVVNSVGREGSARRKITSEVIMKPFNINIHGAIATNVDIKISGNFVVCGYNHRADTPTNAGDIGRAGVGGCNENPGIQHWETTTGDKTGCWTTADFQSTGGAQSAGTPSEQDHQTGFYTGPWDALGMSQAAFWSWVGPPVATEPANFNGIFYIDNNATSQDQSGAYAFNGGTGSGFLYVDGDLTLNSTFTYRGMIYVEGDLKLNGSAWILGAVIVRGKTELKNINGGATVLWSYDAVQQNLTRYGGSFVTVSWKESNY